MNNLNPLLHDQINYFEVNGKVKKPNFLKTEIINAKYCIDIIALVAIAAPIKPK